MKRNGRRKSDAGKYPQDFDYSSKVIQETLTHKQRIDIIYLSVVHEQSLRLISQSTEVPFSTVR